MERRRRFLRFGLSLKAEISPEASRRSFLQGQTVDFSREGLRIIVPFTTSPEDMVDKLMGLRIYLP